MLVESGFPPKESLIRAFVYKVDNGRDRLGTGMVTPQYGSFKTMRKYFLDRLPPGDYHVEAFHDWDKCYGKPDLDIIYHVPWAPRNHEPDSPHLPFLFISVEAQ